MKKAAWIFLCVALLLVGCSMDVDTPTDTKAMPTETTSKTEPTTEAVVNTTAPTTEAISWKSNIPDDLANEIETAFSEIGENPDNIVSVEYVDVHTSGYIFERKCYKVEFSYSFGNPGWKHAKNYLITTQNYFDGEPEKEQYPDEFLVTIKFWAGDDGHGTNVNQWSWTGGGKLQEN